MPIIDIIDYKIKRLIATYLFEPCRASNNTTQSNISVFENVNINQLVCNKSDTRFEEHLTL